MDYEEIFFREARARLVDAGYTLNTPKPKTPPKQSTGVHAVPCVCHFKFDLKAKKHLSLRVSFGLFDSNKNPTGNARNYERFQDWAGNRFDNFIKWTGVGDRGHNYSICFGRREFDISSPAENACTIDWMLQKVERMSDLLEQCFGEIERHK